MKSKIYHPPAVFHVTIDSLSGPSDWAKANMELKPGESIISKATLERMMADSPSIRQLLSPGKLTAEELRQVRFPPRRQGKTDAMGRIVEAAFTKLGRSMVDLTERLIEQNFDKFQARVRAWVDAIGFKMGDKQVRLRRFAEEAAELCQAGGLSYEDFAFITLDAYRRPVGEVGQEIGGVSMTLFALAEAHGFSVGVEAMRELRRVEQPAMIEKIRAKQIEKEARGV